MDGMSPGTQILNAVVRKLAQSSVPVLLLGEAGTGKRTTARQIHVLSGDSGGFHIVACATCSPEMFSNTGQAEWSCKGTLFLDELTALSLPCQRGLLHALTRQGPGGQLTMARVICGSSHDPEAEVRSGKLLEDLYYRLNGVCLRLRPLRQRKEDILPLANTFLSKYAQELGRPTPQLSSATQQVLEQCPWPGNITELENTIKAIVHLGSEAVVVEGLRSLMAKSERQGNETGVSLKQAAREASRQAEKELILRALDRTRWNRRRAAEQLQISYKALLYKLKQIGYSECGTP